MKIRTKIFFGILSLFLILGTTFVIIDYNKIKNNEMPLFMIRITSGGKQKIGN